MGHPQGAPLQTPRYNGLSVGAGLVPDTRSGWCVMVTGRGHPQGAPLQTPRYNGLSVGAGLVPARDPKHTSSHRLPIRPANCGHLPGKNAFMQNAERSEAAKS